MACLAGHNNRADKKTKLTSPSIAYSLYRRNIIADAASIYDIAVSSGIEALLKANCETRATTVTVNSIN